MLGNDPQFNFQKFLEDLAILCRKYFEFKTKVASVNKIHIQIKSQYKL